MNENEIKKQIEFAVRQLLVNQKNFFDFTLETNQSEWNISHHLANEVSKIFSDYDCDLDIIKPNFERKRPDIIFHKRGTNDQNFLVIEVKMDKSGANDDLEKIQDYWFRQPLNYQFGAVVVINDSEHPFVQVITNLMN